MVIGEPAGSIAATKAGTTSMLPPLAASNWEAAAPPSPTAAPIDAATALHSAAGSLSVASHDTHATRGWRRSAHWARTVVFP